MKVLHLHDSDLIGRNFNGYDLQQQLNERGIECKQLVKNKCSDNGNVIQMPTRGYVDQQLMILESILSLNNVFPPYGRVIEQSKEFNDADIIHIHMVHHYLISYLDMVRLTSKKKCVWTIHDPWIFTGHCIYPIKCQLWKTGCKYCGNLNSNFKIGLDNAGQMWKMKSAVFKNIEVDTIVSTNFMLNYLHDSPITKNITNPHVIPFGIECQLFCDNDKKMRRRELQLEESAIVIGFRATDDIIKGCKYIWEMLRRLHSKKKIHIVAIGGGDIPADITNKYNVINFGWCNNQEEIILFHTICDIFLMPSMAESFGVMAIEAMAAESVVICFKGTVLEEITRAPECGIAVEYASSDAILKEVCRLIDDKEEISLRGRRGSTRVKKYYSMEDYVSKHIKLYEDIIKR